MKTNYNNEFYINSLSSYDKSVYRFALSLVKNHEDASDIQQNVMIKAWMFSPNIRDVKKTKEWLLRITYNEVMTFLKRNNKYRRHILDRSFDESQMNEILDPAENILDHLIKLDNIETLNYALNLLAPQQQVLLRLRYMENKSPTEIAKLINKKPTTIRSELCRTHNKLKYIFKKLEQTPHTT